MFYAIKRRSSGQYFNGRFSNYAGVISSRWSRDISKARLWQNLTTAKACLTKIRKDIKICKTEWQKEDLE